MNKKIFSSIKSLTLANKDSFGNNFSPRNFILSVRQYYLLDLIKRHHKFLLKKQNPSCEKVHKKEHKDLESFLLIKDINTESSVYKGTLYEYETISCLQKNFGMITSRVGGASDSGIDFRGGWNLPNGQKLKLVGQCKNYSNKCPPSSVRELEGVVSGLTSENTFGILSSKSGFSDEAINRFKASVCPLIMVSVINNGKKCKSFVWNKSCEKFLDGLDVTMKFSKSDVCDDILEREPILLYNGKPFNEKYWDTENSNEEETEKTK
ncbi:uncharacterized protein OCT59_007842 [Rhizophagus irregularis]|uniref:Restriction endonuclease type IV Mrr domain-containing protein n=2 Tax=Rhizophagus irregularis TaxID=588596 RepID=A0A015L8L7_RHIIW|nr:hypothetical protein RirG_264490 [Rhizophagus irregularis DAOM 197198w]UZO16454.1 hypothetical protein OCT59_007842 [Rhizophagus irregularis]GBC14458.2 putative glutathione s-transferase [Rhizophagus irregularis DAOM 181602=DAOM 197198]